MLKKSFEVGEYSFLCHKNMQLDIDQRLCHCNCVREMEGHCLVVNTQEIR